MKVLLRYISLTVMAVYIGILAYYFLVGTFYLKVFGIRIMLDGPQKPLLIIATASVLFCLVSREKCSSAYMKILSVAATAFDTLKKRFKSVGNVEHNNILVAPPILPWRDFGLIPFIFLSLAVVMTWPIITGLDSYLMNQGDPVFNSWVLWRVNENILHDPLHLMDANIFFPYEKVVAYSENMIAGALIVLPFHLISGNPIVEHNALVIIAFALNGVGMYFLARKLTGNIAASVFAGLIFGFSIPRYDHIQQVQMLSSHWIPLSVLFWIKCLERPTWRNAWLFMLFTTLVMLSNMHFAVYFAYTILFWAVYEMVTKGAVFVSSRMWRLLAPGVVAFAILAPVFIPYLGGEPRNVESTNTFSTFLNPITSNWMYGRWGEIAPVWFTGLTPLVFALIALVALLKGVGRQKSVLLPVLLIGALAAWASMGPDYGLYRVLYDYAPGFDGIRAVGRVAIISLFTLALFGAQGFSIVMEKFPKWRKTLIALVFALFVAESISIPGNMYQHPEISYKRFEWLKNRKDVNNILLLPMVYEETVVTLASAYHRKNMINGYSGYFPPFYKWFKENQFAFPTNEQIRMLQALEIDHIVLGKRQSYIKETRAKLKLFPDLEVIDDQNDLILVRVQPKEISFNRTALLNGDVSEFFSGIPISASLSFIKKPVQAGLLVSFVVEVVNLGKSSVPPHMLSLRTVVKKKNNSFAVTKPLNILSGNGREKINVAIILPPVITKTSEKADIVVELVRGNETIAKLDQAFRPRSIPSAPVIRAFSSDNIRDAGLMLDESLNSRWTTKKSIEKGQWVKLELAELTNINRITLINNEPNFNDYPYEFAIYFSEDGEKWKLAENYTGLRPAREGDLEILELQFESVKARYIKLVVTEPRYGRWWSIHEISMN